MESDHHILDIKPGASIEQIRKAYRDKAKLFHPDKNKNEGASEEFIRLTEAYHRLLNKPKKKITQYSSPIRKQATKDDWREKARRTAKLKYEEWLKSEEQLIENAHAIVAQCMTVLVFGGFLFFLGIYLSVKAGFSGFFGWLAVLAFLGPIYYSIVKDTETLKPSHFIEALKLTFRNTLVVGFFLSVFNILVFIFVGFYTVIPHFVFIALYPCASLICYPFVKQFQLQRRAFFMGAAAPFVISVLLLLNFLIRFPPNKEYYGYVANTSVYKAKGAVPDFLSTLNLQNDAYKNYATLRYFLTSQPIPHKRFIAYTFERGILGVRVMTAYHFVDE